MDLDYLLNLKTPIAIVGLGKSGNSAFGDGTANLTCGTESPEITQKRQQDLIERPVIGHDRSAVSIGRSFNRNAGPASK